MGWSRQIETVSLCPGHTRLPCIQVVEALGSPRHLVGEALWGSQQVAARADPRGIGVRGRGRVLLERAGQHSHGPCPRYGRRCRQNASHYPVSQLLGIHIHIHIHRGIAGRLSRRARGQPAGRDGAAHRARGADGGAARPAADHADARGARQGRPHDGAQGGAGDEPAQVRGVDVQRHGAGALHPSPGGRRGGAPAHEPRRDGQPAQHRLARLHGARGRVGADQRGRGRGQDGAVPAAVPGAVRVPLRGGAGAGAHCQGHVWAHVRAAGRRRRWDRRDHGRAAAGGPRVLRDAERGVPRAARGGRGDGTAIADGRVLVPAGAAGGGQRRRLQRARGGADAGRAAQGAGGRDGAHLLRQRGAEPDELVPRHRQPLPARVPRRRRAEPAGAVRGHGGRAAGGRDRRGPQGRGAGHVHARRPRHLPHRQGRRRLPQRGGRGPARRLRQRGAAGAVRGLQAAHVRPWRARGLSSSSSRRGLRWLASCWEASERGGWMWTW